MGKSKAAARRKAEKEAEEGQPHTWLPAQEQLPNTAPPPTYAPPPWDPNIPPPPTWPRSVMPTNIRPPNMGPPSMTPPSMTSPNTTPQSTLPLNSRPRRRPQNTGPQNVGTRWMGPRGMDPRYMGPRGMDPRYMGPRGMDPRYMGPRGMDPRYMGPHGMDPRSMNPCSMSPRNRGPRMRGPRNRGQRYMGPRYMGPRNLGPRFLRPLNTPPPMPDDSSPSHTIANENPAEVFEASEATAEYYPPSIMEEPLWPIFWQTSECQWCPECGFVIPTPDQFIPVVREQPSYMQVLTPGQALIVTVPHPGSRCWSPPVHCGLHQHMNTLPSHVPVNEQMPMQLYGYQGDLTQYPGEYYQELDGLDGPDTPRIRWTYPSSAGVQTSQPVQRNVPVSRNAPVQRQVPVPRYGMPPAEPCPRGNYVGQHSQGLGGHYADAFFFCKKTN